MQINRFYQKIPVKIKAAHWNKHEAVIVSIYNSFPSIYALH